MNAHQQKGGGLAGDMLFYPFGQEWAYDNGVNSAWWQFYNSFSRWNANLGFDLTPNRKYSPTLGRWMTPDPSGMAAASPSNPQTWNLYAYVLNNPTSLIDTSGLQGGCPEGEMSADGKCILKNPGPPQQSYVSGTDEFPAPTVNVPMPPLASPSGMPGGQGGVGGGGGAYGQGSATSPAVRPQMPNSKCAGLEKKAAQLALTLNRASYASGFGADTVKVLGYVSAIGDFYSLGAGTPVTLTLIGGAGVLHQISVWTGSAAASLNSFARGNSAALEHFGSNQTLDYIDNLLASHIAPITEAGMGIVDAVQQAKNLANAAKGVCQ